MTEPNVTDTAFRKELTAKIAQITGRRFCTTCQREQVSEGGVTLRYRWMCQACCERRQAGMPR